MKIKIILFFMCTFLFSQVAQASQGPLVYDGNWNLIGSSAVGGTCPSGFGLRYTITFLNTAAASVVQQGWDEDDFDYGDYLCLPTLCGNNQVLQSYSTGYNPASGGAGDLELGYMAKCVNCPNAAICCTTKPYLQWSTAAGGSCVPCTTNCTACFSGYYLSGTSCLLCPSSVGVKSCATTGLTCNPGYTGSTCTACASGYYPSGSSCLLCPSSVGVASCTTTALTCNTGYTGTNCASCSTNYYPLVSGATTTGATTSCVFCPSLSSASVASCGPTGLTCNTGYTGSNCASCISTYCMIGGVCQSNTSQTQICNKCPIACQNSKKPTTAQCGTASCVNACTCAYSLGKSSNG